MTLVSCFQIFCLKKPDIISVILCCFLYITVPLNHVFYYNFMILLMTQLWCVFLYVHNVWSFEVITLVVCMLQAVTWIVAALLLIINGYLLLEFFSSEIHGPLFGLVVCVIVVIYMAFIAYLILRGRDLFIRLTSYFTRYSLVQLVVTRCLCSRSSV